MNTKSLLLTAAAVLSLVSAAAKPYAEPRRNFRKMVYPNLVKVTRDEVLQIQKSLPEKPGLYGANIHDRKFWADYPMDDSFLKDAEKRLAMPVPRFSVEEFNAGHIAGAVNIPHTAIAEKISSVTNDKSTPLYLYCRSGRRVGIAMESLKNSGYKTMYNLGGMEEAEEKLRSMKQ